MSRPVTISFTVGANPIASENDIIGIETDDGWRQLYAAQVAFVDRPDGLHAGVLVSFLDQNLCFVEREVPVEQRHTKPASFPSFFEHPFDLLEAFEVRLVEFIDIINVGQSVVLVFRLILEQFVH